MALIPLTPHNLAGHTWHPLTDSAFVRPLSLVELNASEMPAAACQLPTGFIQQGDDRYTVQALLSLTPGKNLFVAADGSWLGGYWPQRWRDAPFALGTSDAGEHLLCIEDTWYKASAGGHPFFDARGAVSPQVAAVITRLQGLLAQEDQTRQCVAELHAAGLIAPWNPWVGTQTQGNIQLDGLYRIDEQRLNQVDAATLLDLRNSGALALAYCQLISMQHLHKLAELADAHARLDAQQQATPPTLQSTDLFAPMGDTLKLT